MAKGPSYGKVQTRIEPQGRIRTSQIVSTFGPGAMVDLLDSAVLVGGLDFWSFDKAHGRTVIREPRLRDALAPSFKQWYRRELAVDDAFREPPVGDEREPSKYAGVQVLEFPQWFVCQNSSCRALVRNDLLKLEKGRYWHDCTSSKKTECVPIRFLGACRRGHCHDLLWIAIAHLKRERCAQPDLALEEGPTGDFSQVRVICRGCGAETPLSTLSSGLDLPCDGHRPWLGGDARQECNEKTRLLVRTASNSYFAQVVSALSVPDPSQQLADGVASVWDVLQAVTVPETIAAFLTIPKVKLAVGAYAPADIMAAIEARRSGKLAAREPLRTAEYRQFRMAPDEVLGELPPDEPSVTFWVRAIARRPGLPKSIACVVLAPKLREVRAQIGFTRLEPRTPNLQGEYALDVEVAPLGLITNWLPASEIRGEGVFIELDESAVRAWEARPAVKAREAALRAGFEAHAAESEGAGEFPGVRFYLLHSLSHLLLTSISLTCGYAASAIRERIYCAPATDAVPMAAVLLSTGTSGSEGTLGGLVEQGRALGAHLRAAYDYGVLCSNDPVCAAHSPEKDREERHLEGAACHGCLFVAECSCERFNRYLDRSLVVPTMGHDAELAFFGERP